MMTIRDVARRAGVAVSTVSRVLNESGYVRQETRERVVAAIAELDFRPNLLARGLISRTSYTIALILPDLTNPFYGPLAKGVEAVARAAGFTVIICSAENDPGTVTEWIRQLRTNWIKGVLFAMDPPAEQVWGLVDDQIPFVLVDQEIPGFDTDRVLINARDGAKQAVRYLAELGHRRIAHIAGPRRGALERYDGYIEALLEAGLLPAPELISAPGDFSQDHGYRAMQALLEIPSDRRPTAVFCVNDLAAVGALRAAEDQGLRVPEDLSIVGYDDILWARLITPGFTTVAQPVQELGRLTTELLVRRINQEPIGGPQRVCLNTSLVVRASAAPPGKLAAIEK